MTENIIICDPEDELDYIEHVMTQCHIRNLSVIINKRLVGIMSSGDVIKAQLNAVRVINRYLHDIIEKNIKTLFEFFGI